LAGAVLAQHLPTGGRCQRRGVFDVDASIGGEQPRHGIQAARQQVQTVRRVKEDDIEGMLRLRITQKV
jgi:hypothetical protein